MSAKRKLIKILLVVVLVFAIGVVAKLFWQSKNGVAPVATQESGLTQILQNTTELKDAVSLMPNFLGYDKPRIYLVLFLNNAEIRPGGGFIGSYAVVKLDKGKLTSFESSGSENLDWAAPDDFKVEPPEALKKYLYLKNWYFRDANWSPDWRESARAALWFYRFEGGADGSKIDGVIGLTPRIVEELVKITGPVTVEGKVFNTENIIDELQYQVEVGFLKEGKPRAERKELVEKLGRELLKKIADLSPWKWAGIYSMAQEMFKEKQLMIWSSDDAMEAALIKQGWAGEVKQVDGDHLMVVDANMAALKTDPEVDRSIHYEIKPDGERLKARVTVSYNHHGEFDWKTTRYRSYTRVYVPLSSELISSNGFIENDKIRSNGKIESVPAKVGEELGKTVFGGFIAVEPGESKTLVLEYYLPEKITQQATAGLYTLFVQKQLGTVAPKLTVDVDFGKTVKQESRHQETNLLEDRRFRF
ncbi:MAG TPA: hypothetical protein DEB73_00305 [Candidatus Magasanikbacteria bacterium]|uniref:DUF4012 domain-containing protein n=2 Tax=Candidatus Magasanikiibacteriota TaxID=1752731 RepID=A0A0G0WL85_9BACT|nr:MAG: hypothetical protein UU49_C0005G0048 [Candidatus Magasanikbacteria bacterium GW2011_GWC2_41_17]KKS13574.1 MAG: hypothetical protein UU69_C0002G0009 [Candidatus Magasanikbacteria bacterium GW2011_GWA2_41_55]HBV57710.1 hypothetical protein [Candidatus Magasanikbacteria bacterium]HBX16218.1 hypothetical protein [Candidatus Magasanikbacteria bacterium]